MKSKSYLLVRKSDQIERQDIKFGNLRNEIPRKKMFYSRPQN